ncbi:MAG: hypothetical protein SO119_07675 [Phascolarctobacterium sp.]|nr:hypothetical protein [Phascolarctobacterium sp.]
MLEGFEVYNMTIGTTSISISENGIGFSKAAVAKLNMAPYAKILIDRKGMRIAIQASVEKEDGSVPFYRNQKSGSVRWNNKELLKTLSQMMKCDFNKKVYKIDGDYLPDEKAMIFDLKNAVLQP